MSHMHNPLSLQESSLAQQIIKSLHESDYASLVKGSLKGIEKEGLRVTLDGQLCQTPHPKALGSALTHSLITTDFSEALLEFITPPTHLDRHVLEDLFNVHRYSYLHLNDERIWPLSMPCQLPEDDAIPVAQYGSSNRARMKTIYREGLGLRYGRTMQTVAGLHYNYSMPRAFWALLHQQEDSFETLENFTTRKYFDLIRNFRRYYWLLIYLFGASPVVDASFVDDRPHNLTAFGNNTLGLEYATALRMGNLGYQSSAQAELFVCYNALESYLKTLTHAIKTPYGPYEHLGKGSNRQLNTSLLQIENEFYSPIRPKRTAKAGETALTALCNRGVEYLEVRCMDLDPFEPLGIAPATVKFLDTFLLYCLLLPSSQCDRDEFTTSAENQRKVVTRGREPGLTLIAPDGDNVTKEDWATRLLDDMSNIAALLATAYDDTTYLDALQAQKDKVIDPTLTPSAQLIARVRSGESHVDIGLALANQHHAYFSSKPMDDELFKRFSDMSAESLQLQITEEASVEMPFEEYLAKYYAQYNTCCV